VRLGPLGIVLAFNLCLAGLIVLAWRLVG